MTSRRPRRRARACGSFAGGALFWAFCHILQYYCSDNARSALETGRPATSGNLAPPPNITVTSKMYDAISVSYTPLLQLAGSMHQAHTWRTP